MNKRIDITELQRKFQDVFEEVIKTHTSYILMCNSRPEAVLIPYDQYLRFLHAEEAGVLKRIDDALTYMAQINAQYNDDEIEADLKEASRIFRSP